MKKKLHRLFNVKIIFSFLLILSFLILPISKVIALDAPLQSLDVNGVNIYNVSDGYNSAHGISGISFNEATHVLTMNNASVNNISASGDLDIAIVGTNEVSPTTDSTAIIAMNGDLTITGDNATLDITAFSSSQIAITIGSGGRLTIGETGNSIEVTVTQGILNNCDDTYVITGNTFNSPDSGDPSEPPAGDPIQIYVGGALKIDETANPQVTSASGTGWTIEYSRYGGYQINIDAETSPTFGYISGTGDGTISINANGGDVTISANSGYSVNFDGNVGILFAMGPEDQVGDVYMTGGIFTHGSVNGGDGDVFIGTPSTKSTYGIGASEVNLNFGDITINTTGTGLHHYDPSVAPEEELALDVRQNAEFKIQSSNIATSKVASATVLGGGTIDLSYTTGLGTFTPQSGYWEWAEFSGTGNENTDPTIVECVEGNSPDNKYSLTISSGNFLLESTSKALYQLGYNYEDSEDSRVVNGTVNVIAANGYKFVSGGFYDFSIEEGTEVTIELLPNYGYQYVSGGINGMPTSPEEGKASYTFTMPANHVHISAIFEETSDIISLNTTKIEAVGLTMPAEQINGNAELLISNSQNVTTSNFESVKGDFTIDTYLDFTLNEVISKGDTDEFWRTNLTELEDDTTVKLTLSDELEGHAEYTILREHDGVVEELETIYDATKGTLTFNTDAYSTYAVAYKDTANPNTYDGVLKSLALGLTGTLGLCGLTIYVRKFKTT